MGALLAGLSFFGLVLLLGGTFARRWLTPGVPPAWVPGAGLGLLLLGWGGQVAVTLTTLGVTALADMLAYLTDTGTGRGILTGLMGASVLVAAEFGGWPWGLSLGAALVTAWGAAGIGHGAGHGWGVRGLHAGHVGAMSVWVGGVLALLTAQPLLVSHARRFTPAALGSVLVLAGTGLVMSGEHLTTAAQWTESPYGQTLLVKLLLMGLTVGAALLVRRAFNRRQGTERAALAREALLLTAILGATALLTTQPPPPSPAHAEHGASP